MLISQSVDNLGKKHLESIILAPLRDNKFVHPILSVFVILALL